MTDVITPPTSDTAASPAPVHTNTHRSSNSVSSLTSVKAKDGSLSSSTGSLGDSLNTPQRPASTNAIPITPSTPSFKSTSVPTDEIMTQEATPEASQYGSSPAVASPRQPRAGFSTSHPGVHHPPPLAFINTNGPGPVSHGGAYYPSPGASPSFPTPFSPPVYAFAPSGPGTPMFPTPPMMPPPQFMGPPGPSPTLGPRGPGWKSGPGGRGGAANTFNQGPIGGFGMPPVRKDSLPWYLVSNPNVPPGGRMNGGPPSPLMPGPPAGIQQRRPPNVPGSVPIAPQVHGPGMNVGSRTLWTAPGAAIMQPPTPGSPQFPLCPQQQAAVQAAAAAYVAASNGGVRFMHATPGMMPQVPVSPSDASSHEQHAVKMPTPTQHAQIAAALASPPPIPPPVVSFFATNPNGTPASAQTALEAALYNPGGGTNVYVRGLPPDITDDMLHTIVGKFGRVISSKAILDQNQNGMCKGFGFAMFDTEDEAINCIAGMMQVGYQVSFAKESFSTRLKNLSDPGSTNLYLSNLPADMHERDLEELFAPCQVISNRILRDTNNQSRGVGFARMADKESAEMIIEKFNGAQIPGSDLPLQVRYADSASQKRLKATTARRRIWRAREFNVLTGRASLSDLQELGLDPGTLATFGISVPTIGAAGQENPDSPLLPNGMYPPVFSPIHPPYHASDAYVLEPNDSGFETSLVEPAETKDDVEVDEVGRLIEKYL
ncbi:hypothetical protein YB2330_001218 [Saitoella coloradoensis]